MRDQLIHKVDVKEQYGLWTVIARMHRKAGEKDFKAYCKCYCGTVRPVVVRKLTTNKSKSCGCGTTYGSQEAMEDLLKIWQGIPANYQRNWDGYPKFEKWALKQGYKLGSQLKHEGWRMWWVEARRDLGGRKTSKNKKGLR